MTFAEEEIDRSLGEIRAALEAGDSRRAKAVLEALHPIERAETFVELTPEDQRKIIPTLDTETTGELLSELSDREAVEVAEQIAPEKLAPVLDELRADVAADILHELPDELASSTLAQMEEAGEVRPLLQYDEGTTGSIMRPFSVVLSLDQNAGAAIEALRSSSPDQAVPYYLYVVDGAGVLHGVVGLRDLITAAPEVRLSEIMRTEIARVVGTAPRAEAVAALQRYDLAALPVVNDRGVLVGVVHASDAVDVVAEQGSEELFKFANVGSTDLSVWSPYRESLRQRLPWLTINLATAFLAAWVVSIFEATIAQLAVLAALQGIIAGQGGNAASQTLAIMVRSVALGEVAFRDARAAILRESLLGLIQGVVIGLLVGLGTWWWLGNVYLGLVVAVAMVGNMLAAGVSGALIPLTLRRFGADPAVASTVIVTTVTDCVGFALFLGLATLMLGMILG